MFGDYGVFSSQVDDLDPLLFQAGWIRPLRRMAVKLVCYIYSKECSDYTLPFS